VCALDKIHLDVSGAEVLGILGESGCGKSTLAHAILQVLPPNARAACAGIFFRDRDLMTLSESDLRAIRGRHISLVSQDPALSLNPVMTVGSQIAEVLRAHLPLTGKERRTRTDELLREVGFDQPAAIRAAYPHQLSGGQRQRVVIAQAIACRPDLLIADEPTSKLDAHLRGEMVALLSRIREVHGTAILLISHDPTLFLELADRVAVMHAGRVVEIGRWKDVLGRPVHSYTRGLVDAVKSSMAGRQSRDAIADDSTIQACGAGAGG
jgi:ABC-type dipeptide/oligopeptide/nickel transport system ATPase component